MVDTHTHIGDKTLCAELQAIIDGLESDGMEFIVENAYDVESARFAAELAEKNARIFAAAGIHPEFAGDVTEADYDAVKAIAYSKKVVAIGEIGLDYHYEGYNKEAQKAAMIRQIMIADELKLPVVFHIRDAYEDAEKVMRDYADCLKNGVLLHCYSGSREMLERYAFIDPYVAFGGAITFKNNRRGDVIRAVRRDRIVAETDCPYLTPVPYRGQINYPKNVRFVIERLADELGMTFEDCEKLTTENARRFFKI